MRAEIAYVEYQHGVRFKVCFTAFGGLIDQTPSGPNQPANVHRQAVEGAVPLKRIGGRKDIVKVLGVVKRISLEYFRNEMRATTSRANSKDRPPDDFNQVPVFEKIDSAFFPRDRRRVVRRLVPAKFPLELFERHTEHVHVLRNKLQQRLRFKLR